MERRKNEGADMSKRGIAVDLLAIVVGITSSLCGLIMMASVTTVHPPFKDPRLWPFVAVSLVAAGVLFWPESS